MDQVGNSHQAVVVEGDTYAGRGVCVVASMCAPCLRPGSCFESINPDSKEYPCILWGGLLPPLVRWVRARRASLLKPVRTGPKFAALGEVLAYGCLFTEDGLGGRGFP